MCRVSRNSGAIGRNAGLLLALAALLLLLGYDAAPAQAAKGKRSGKGRTGTMVLRVEGLPRGERAAVTVTGPRQSRSSGKRFRRRIARQGIVRLRGLRSGAYRVKLDRVEMRRAHGAVKRGAVAFPIRRRLKVKVPRRKRVRAKAAYGTIRNSGVSKLRGRVLRVIGKRSSPRGLVLQGRHRYRRGTILSARPGGKLPRGLLAHVKSVRAGARRTVLRLRAASIYEVAPNMSFRTRLQVEQRAGTSAFDCGMAGTSIDPFVEIGNPWVNASWTTTRVVGHDITTGARVDLDFDVRAGIDIVTQARISCALSVRAFSVHAFPAGIPVFGAIKPSISGSIGAGAHMRPEGKVRVELGARIGAVPPAAYPEVGFSSPEFNFGADVFAEAGLGLAINSDIGIGVDEAANIHVRFGNSLDFNARIGSCSWDLNLGSFSAAGKVDRWAITTPSTPPLATKNLWSSPCGPPPLPLPLTRAEMSWTTDADVDLYAWDAAGTVAYYGERTTIPGAELVNDVIPSEGETIHESEFFVENESPGRQLTFGVCLFRGDATDVTLRVPPVPDPRGATRVLNAHLAAPGDGVVLATSPEEPGYAPPPGWCRSVAD